MFSWLRHHLAWVVAIGLFFITATLGLGGINFGSHGDEPKLLNALAESTRTFLLLPRWYNYPSLSYDALLVTALPEWKSIALEAVRKGVLTPPSTQASESVFLSLPFIERGRTVFFLLTWLSLVWIFLGILSFTKKPWAALFAMALAACSWELQYHARWMAPDGLVVSFGSLSVAALLWFFSTKRQVWLWVAALGAGLACSAKYPGGIFLLPVFIACFEDVPASNWRQLLHSSILRHRMLKVTALFFGVFLLTTPGALVDSFKFISGILFEMRHYHTEHGANTVHSSLEHGTLLIRYLAEALFSSNIWIALGASLIILIGCIKSVRALPHIPRLALIVPPLLYILYMSSQHVMIVRNYLLLLPFLCLFGAYGIQVIWRIAQKPLARLVLVLLVISGFGYNLVWQYQAMQTIRYPELTQNTALHTLELDREHVFLSPAAQIFLGQNIKNSVTDPAQADSYVFLDHEIDPRYPANHVGLYQVLGGSLESNPNFYPTFLPGPIKVLEIKMSLARAQGIIK